MCRLCLSIPVPHSSFFFPLTFLFLFRFLIAYILMLMDVLLMCMEVIHLIAVLIIILRLNSSSFSLFSLLLSSSSLLLFSSSQFISFAVCIINLSPLFLSFPIFSYHTLICLFPLTVLLLSSFSCFFRCILSMLVLSSLIFLFV